MKFNFKNHVFAVAAAALLNFLPVAGFAQYGTTIPGNPWGFGVMGGYNDGGIISSGVGMIKPDTKQPITPRLSTAPEPIVEHMRQFNLLRSLEAIRSTGRTLEYHIAEQRFLVSGLSTELTSKNVTPARANEIKAEIARLQSENRLFVKALTDNKASEKKADADFQAAKSKRQPDRSQGWVIADPSGDEDTKSKSPISCASGQRAVSRLSFSGMGMSAFPSPSQLAEHACLDSKGFIVKETALLIAPTGHATKTTKTYERDGANILSVKTLDGNDKPVKEVSYPNGSEVHTSFSADGSPSSSCTYYGDASRNRGNGIGGSPSTR